MTPREALIDWVESITDWTTKLDMTFSWNCDEFRAKKVFTRWMENQLPGSTFLYAVERDPNQEKVSNAGSGLNQACHIHAIADTNWDILKAKKGQYRRDFWQDWKSRYGMNRIDQIKNISDASGYALKKVLNYSEARADQTSHMRKTDVDWGLQFGKGRHAAKAKARNEKQWTLDLIQDQTKRKEKLVRH